MSSTRQKRREPKVRDAWGKLEEADDFAKTVKMYRQGWYDADSFRRYRLQHGAYGTRMTGDYAMVRVKLPAGEVLPAQLDRLARLSETYSIGSAHVSTRENVQLHWVVLEDVSEIFRELAKVGLTSREACGNTVRNVMCSPTSGVCPGESFDATPYAISTAKFFLRNPLCQNLPRKFKFNFTCCEEHGMVRIVDVGLLPQVRTTGAGRQRGFKIFLGGGLGNKSFVGHQLEEFTPEEDLLYTSTAVVRIFDRLGDRKNMARNRMRYLVHELGWEIFRDMVLKERAIVRATQSMIATLRTEEPAPVTSPIRVSTASAGAAPAGLARWIASNTVRQKQDGYSAVFVTLEAGDITANQLRALADICRDYSAEGLARTGFSQDIVVRYVRQDDLASVYSQLQKHGLANPGALTMATPVGCSGTTSCNLALTNSHRLAKEIQREFLRRGLDEDGDLRDSSIKISGCPNSCGQHEIATIGLHGGGGRSGRNMYPVYQLSLGGRSDGGSILGVNCIRVPAKRVIPAILKIIEIFKENKKPSDTLKTWTHRVVSGNEDSGVRSVTDIRDRLREYTVPPDIADDEDFYADFGSDASYHTRTGKGECAA